jgi:predicted ATP-grasp superfamily ATP-dependent carboligase
VVLERRHYSRGFIRVAEQAPPGPWIYVGGLENRRSLVGLLAKRRPLFGNSARVLGTVRSPPLVERLLRASGIDCPAIRLRAQEVPREGRWLVKPLAGAGGNGIRRWRGASAVTQAKGTYFQEFIEGESIAAIYVGDGQHACLLGVTRQLVGENWLHAAPFQYCGSIGPVPLTTSLKQGLDHLGTALSGGTGLAGLFGVDCILQGDRTWPVEINPRYTASAEILEHALEMPFLALHRHVFESECLGRGALRAGASRSTLHAPTTWIGKAIYYAPRALTFPLDGPWLRSLGRAERFAQLPEFADIPPAGQPIGWGWPVLTLFARGDSLETCRDWLQQIAADLDRWLLDH